MKSYLKVNVKRGYYKTNRIRNEEFTMFEGFTPNERGGYIVVNGERFGHVKIRVQLNFKEDMEIVGGAAPAFKSTSSAPVASMALTNPTPERTDEELLDEMVERHDIMVEMARAVIAGDVRGMIIQGPPGVGKSYTIYEEIERAKERNSMFDKLANRYGQRYEIFKGGASALGLYTFLYKFSAEGCTVVIDDGDTLLEDNECLLMLMSALDSGKRRKIFWNTDSKYLKKEGIPEQFEFQGTIIFLTNLKLTSKAAKLGAHLDALKSRCLFLNLNMETMRERILWVKRVVMTDDFFAKYAFDEAQRNEVFNFMTANCERLQEVSIRMATKLCDLVRINSDRWQRIAHVTCFK